jgi:MoaA/NifB/PqqE/SkfB family radical SAM enzyme
LKTFIVSDERINEAGCRAVPLNAGQKDFLHRNLDLCGVLNSPHAFTGPGIAQIDLTNNCNNDCLGCWCHSHLLGKERMPPAEKQKRLPWRIIHAFIEDLTRMGCREIVLAGSGEPLMHPAIEKILALISARGLRGNLITNCTLLNDKLIHQLVDGQIHTLTASIWAGSAEAYHRTHPSQKKGTFGRLTGLLHLLRDYKAERRSPYPRVKVCHVLMHPNARDISNMVDFALEVRADELDLTVVDIVPGKTDSLRLTATDQVFVQQYLQSLRQRRDYFPPFTGAEAPGGSGPAGQDLPRWGSLLYVPEGFRFDSPRLKLICPRGQETGLFYGDHDRGVVNFQFNRERCQACDTETCGIDQHYWTKSVGGLNLTSCDTVMRRLRDSRGPSGASLAYDKNIIDRIPCTVGWIYTRLLVNGDVVPCCKAYQMPLGNLFQQSFRDIWSSRGYDEFRHRALTLKKSHPYFHHLACYRVCDNLAMLLSTQQRLGSLVPEQIALLRRHGQELINYRV